jgi:hypothetical protein
MASNLKYKFSLTKTNSKPSLLSESTSKIILNIAKFYYLILKVENRISRVESSTTIARITIVGGLVAGLSAPTRLYISSMRYLKL